MYEPIVYSIVCYVVALSYAAILASRLLTVPGRRLLMYNEKQMVHAFYDQLVHVLLGGKNTMA